MSVVSALNVSLDAPADPLAQKCLDLLGAQDGKTLASREGKEALRSAIKDKINELIVKYKGTGEVDAVLFSSFVMQ